jgi:hypothetical protein
VTRAEEIARLNAAELRKPRVDSFAKSKQDIKDNVEAAKLAKPKVIVVPPKSGGILRVDMGLKEAGVE